MRRNDQLGVAEPEHVRSRVLRKRTRVAIVFEPEPDKEQAQLDLRRAEVFDVYKEPQTPLYLQMKLGQKLFPNRFRQIRQVSRKPGKRTSILKSRGAGWNKPLCRGLENGCRNLRASDAKGALRYKIGLNKIGLNNIVLDEILLNKTRIRDCAAKCIAT